VPGCPQEPPLSIVEEAARLLLAREQPVVRQWAARYQRDVDPSERWLKLLWRARNSALFWGWAMGEAVGLRADRPVHGLSGWHTDTVALESSLAHHVRAVSAVALRATPKAKYWRLTIRWSGEIRSTPPPGSCEAV
jgi:hypothetical protein